MNDIEALIAKIEKFRAENDVVTDHELEFRVEELDVILAALHNAFPALLAAAREQVKVIDERAEFEKWYMGGTVGEYDLSHVLKRYLNGMYLDQYIDYELQKQWIAWQARAKLAEGK